MGLSSTGRDKRDWLAIGCRLWVCIVAAGVVSLWTYLLASFFGVAVWELVWKGCAVLAAFFVVVVLVALTIAAYEIGFDKELIP